MSARSRGARAGRRRATTTRESPQVQQQLARTTHRNTRNTSAEPSEPRGEAHASSTTGDGLPHHRIPPKSPAELTRPARATRHVAARPLTHTHRDWLSLGARTNRRAATRIEHALSELTTPTSGSCAHEKRASVLRLLEETREASSSVPPSCPRSRPGRYENRRRAPSKHGHGDRGWRLTLMPRRASPSQRQPRPRTHRPGPVGPPRSPPAPASA